MPKQTNDTQIGKVAFSKMKETGENKGTYFQFFVAVTANLMAITDGMSVGWTAPMIPYFLSSESHIKMTQRQAEWMETILLLGAVIGLPLTAYSVNKIGRKKSLLLATFILIICWIVILVADRIEYMYGARFVNGFGLNMAFVAAPMYVGEISHKDIRGFLSSNVFIMSMSGIVLIYSIGPYVPFYVPSVIAIILLTAEIIIFPFMPESPYYLVLINKHEEARKSLKKFRGDADIETELQQIIEAVEIDNQQEGTIKDFIFVKSYRKAILIMTVLNSAQLFSSFEVILMNLHEILNNAGSVYMDSSLAAIVFSVINLLASLAASLLIDKFGRKFLLVTSSILTGCCLFFIAVYFNLKFVGYNTIPYSWIPIVSVMIYAAVFKFGLGMVPIVLTAEIFASKVKAYGMTIADGVYVLASILALQTFFALRDTFDMHVPFYIFCFCSFSTGMYVALFLPETKGKSLDEIQQILRGEVVQIDKQSEQGTISERTYYQ